MSILAELYEWYESNKMKPGSYPNKSEAENHFSTLWKEAEEQLSQKLSEELRASIFDYMDDECYSDFQAGFRLGALLMLELQNAAQTEPY